MLTHEFVEATSRLEKYYNKEYTTAQLEIMYDELKHFDIERYRQLISAALKKCQNKPKIADFYLLDAEIPRNSDENAIEKVECTKCNGTGYITYKKFMTDGNKKLEYIYAARCNCENGNNAQRRVPTAKELGLRV